MLRDPKVIEHLNTQLTNELTSINQYFLHARILDHWGVAKLGKREYDESIDEMKHADSLIQRILFLGGLPNVQRLDQIAVGETIEEILKADLALEEKGASPILRAKASLTARARASSCPARPVGVDPRKRGRRTSISSSVSSTWITKPSESSVHAIERSRRAGAGV